MVVRSRSSSLAGSNRKRQYRGKLERIEQWQSSTNMPFIDLTLQHGQTLEEARRRLEATVSEVNATFGSMIQRVDWAADRNRVKLEGLGFWVEMSVDAQALHAMGDIPILGRLLGGQMTSGLRQIVERIFQKKLPP
jgi:hypothetical protein